MKNLIVIGANDMRELLTSSYITDNYDKGLFIEASDDINMLKTLNKNLRKCNEKYNKDYKFINKLITSKDGDKVNFNVFNFENTMNSIYLPNPDNWIFEAKTKPKKVINLKSISMNTLLSQEGWSATRFDVIIDVQGAELEVLKGFNDMLNNINKLTIEVSTIQFYKDQSTFKEIDEYLNENGFKLEDVNKEIPIHGDVVYIRKD
tara:strand:- start:1646 stop:2260 length:615 start_codon:yes stop_codon:yes gene_type:complete